MLVLDWCWCWIGRCCVVLVTKEEEKKKRKEKKKSMSNKKTLCVCVFMGFFGEMAKLGVSWRERVRIHMCKFAHLLIRSLFRNAASGSGLGLGFTNWLLPPLTLLLFFNPIHVRVLVGFLGG